jgi:hypothetical protein
MPSSRTRYAGETTVPVERSRNEIEKMLRDAGGTSFGYLSAGDDQVIVFELHNRRIWMRLPMPDRTDKEFTHTPNGRRRAGAAEVDKFYQQAVRARWRALALYIKAQLEAVNAGITTVERAFLADIALPGGGTLGEQVLPHLGAVDRGELPELLPSRSQP